MKTAIYIEDGVVQLVLTPENDWEKNALQSFGDDVEGDGVVDAKVFTGSFYDCRGGWVRQSHYSSGFPGITEYNNDERSLIITSKHKADR